jgi:hypothetical protein
MKIESKEYKIWYDNSHSIVFFEGSLRHYHQDEYTMLQKFLIDILELEQNELTLDFYNLIFLNSAGISTLCKFVLSAKDQNKIQLKIIGNNEILWQVKSFGNFKRIWKKIKIEFK